MNNEMKRFLTFSIILISVTAMAQNKGEKC